MQCIATMQCIWGILQMQYSYYLRENSDKLSILELIGAPLSCNSQGSGAVAF